MGANESDKKLIQPIVDRLWEMDYARNTRMSPSLADYKNEYDHLNDVFRRKVGEYISRIGADNMTASVDSCADKIFGNIMSQERSRAQTAVINTMRSPACSHGGKVVAFVAGVGLLGAAAYAVAGGWANRIRGEQRTTQSTRSGI